MQFSSSHREMMYGCLLSMALLAPFFFAILLHGYVSSTDEAWQLQAAFRLANGEGYTCSWKPANDLSVPKYDYLIAWPAGYSLSIASFLKLGFSLDAAAKCFKIVCIILGVLLWLNFMRHLINSFPARLLFLTFVSSTAIYYSFSPTDLVFWAIFPLFSSIMLTWSGQIMDPAPKKQLMNILVCSVLVSVLILIRYQALAMIPMGGLWLFLQNRKRVSAAFIKALFFCLLPILTYLAIWFTNNKFGGGASIHTSSGIQSISWNWNWVLGVFQALLVAPFHIDKIMSKLSAASQFSEMNRVLLDAITIFMLAGTTYVLYKRWKSTTAIRHLLGWFFLCLLSVVGLLALLTIFYFPSSSSDWVPLTEPRYYWFLLPLFLIILLTALDQVSTRLAERARIHLRLVTVAVFLLGEVGVVAYCVSKNNNAEIFNKEKELLTKEVASVSSLEAGIPRFAVAPNRFMGMLLWEDFIPAYRELSDVFQDSMFFSKPTLVLLIGENVGSTDLKGKASIENITNLASRFRMEGIENQSFTLIWRRFEIGTLRDQSNEN